MKDLYFDIGKSRPSNTIGVKTGCLDHEMKPMACEAKNYFLCSMEGDRMFF